MSEEDLLAPRLSIRAVLRVTFRVTLLVGLLALGVSFWVLLVDLSTAWSQASASVPGLVGYGLYGTAQDSSATGTPASGVAPPGSSPTPTPDVFPVLGFEQAGGSAPPGTLAPGPRATATPSPAPAGTATAGVLTPTAAPLAAASSTPSGRAPWILLPEPAAGSSVAAGAVTVGARASGDAPITSISVQVDGGSIPATMDQRSSTIWLGTGVATLAAGRHAVRVDVRDATGRSGSYTWAFDVHGP